MNITEEYGLPFVRIVIAFRGKELELNKMLLDTGSASTLFNADLVQQIGMEAIHFDGHSISHFQVEIGSMDYGMEIDGIIGFDFMKVIGLIIDTNEMTVSSHR
ncbi:hypothetical protein J2Z22_004418 [Paenibacillus forsythiae]|uniref:Peptidase A2 domain-containing protein n=1 Tax=Paenibacillus forsythiae TaxID=365616 RepID=A0ABU3HDD3_9BACL|nr:hypothetical protein [Paenibacillus forsythiae]MDT3428824.1 hypothetical protein [Paenibacillus forsythiae]